MPGLVFWASGLVFECLDLYFGCLDLYFVCLDLYLGVWTCIFVYGLVFWVSVYLQDVTMARALPSPNKAPAEFP